jgi:hypothetical protein
MSMRRAFRQLGLAALVTAGCLVSGCSSNSDQTSPDTFAPAAPSNLRAITVEGAGRGTPAEQYATIQLDWDPNGEADLAGYNLYAAKDGGTYELAGIIPAGTITFQDVRERGHTYEFVVKAIDRSENESTPSNQVSLRAPMFPTPGGDI